jgi:hypothetical protein
LPGAPIRGTAAWLPSPSPPADQEAVTVALGLLVEAAGDEYGVTAHRPVPL